MIVGERTVEVDFAALMTPGGQLDPLAHDLLALGREAYLLDRHERRGASPDDRRWHRTLRVVVPVQSPRMWSRPEVTSAVHDLLGWITDDSWEVSWAPIGVDPGTSGQSRFDLDASRDVILFSGGLDATAGTALLLGERQLEAVAISTNQRMQAYQARTVNALRAARLGSLASQQVRFSVRHGRRDAESSRRTRGLVFLAIGAAMARRRSRNGFIMAENGIGALNLPLTKAQTGAMTSRSAHPKTLKLFEQVVGLVSQADFTVEAPFLGMTKAEMVGLVPDAARAACTASESCDSAAAGRGDLQRRCGYCSSCLLRRMAFHAAGRSDWDHPQYLSDIEEDRELSQEPEMLWQAAQLERALLDPDPGQLLREFPDLADVPLDSLDRAAQRRLLTRYVNEWRVQPSPLVPRFLHDTPLVG